MFLIQCISTLGLKDGKFLETLQWSPICVKDHRSQWFLFMHVFFFTLPLQAMEWSMVLIKIERWLPMVENIIVYVIWIKNKYINSWQEI